ncbi:hypothetical protein VZT92_027599 [Zoarces viviparus]|uniref:Uncharacterized protein n=1 Tax=Zoarces viviparus TaxID=48416 RepID=A0AAW1DX94_ZOAVI
MASETVPGCSDLTMRTEEAVSRDKQDLEDIEDRLVTLSDKLNLCNQVLNDLKALSGVLVRKSLQDVSSLPPQK